MDLSKQYNPQDFEDKIYQAWEKSGFFNPDNLKLPDDAPIFSVMMPPPNVTGILHLGHALENALMDTNLRYQRMLGKRALLVPGTDHAAVATQARVEKELIKSGQYRNPRAELGREKLLEKIREYAENSKATILKQIRKMGTSCDWSRLAYTFDEKREKAVNEIFVRMYHNGLIYRGYRLINWDPKLQTTISDDEIVWTEEKTPLYYFQYGPFVIATARPETKFGDKYVVMHPDDKRYEKYKHGETFECEWINGKITATVIKDAVIDPEFGTGVMTITPWHDATDFALAQKHKLKMEQIIDMSGRLLPIAQEFAGQKILEARPKIVEKLQAKGLLVRTEENYIHRVAKGDRSNSLIEPQIMKQWFVDVNKEIPGRGKSLKDLMREVFTTGLNGDPKQKIQITPERFEKVYFNWIDNLRDWCISRQIWWGHQIPVWYRQSTDDKQQTTDITTPSPLLEKEGSSPTVVSPPRLGGGGGVAPFNSPPYQGEDIEGVNITYFVHGATADNEKGVRSGWTNPKLNDLGKKQNEELKKAVQESGDHYDIIFCSDLSRAKDTAEFVFGESGTEIKTDKRLREMNYGDLNGHPESEFEKDEKYYIEHRHPNGENCHDVEKRVREFLDEVTEKFAGKKIAIVGHMYPQLAMEVITNHKTWEQAFDDDWRQTKTWQAGWKYQYRQQTTDNPKGTHSGQLADITTPSPLLEKEGMAEEIYVGTEPPAGDDWQRDPDTLDTWFSSGLWTFSTLGWPEQTTDLKRFHPTSWMQMGYEILFFWLARMILMSTYALAELPFKKVYIHGVLRDIQNKKFSKSLGNGLDPLDMCAKYGTDALRMSLISGVSPGNDARFYEDKVKNFRNFANKIWNIGRFIQLAISHPTGDPPITTPNPPHYEKEGKATDDLLVLQRRIRLGLKKEGRLEVEPKTLADKWVASKTNNLIKEVTEDLENCRFSLAAEKLYEFTWHEFADWYLEIAKIQNNDHTNQLLAASFQLLLKLLHPFMPFVTEVIYQSFNPTKMLLVEKWPAFVPLSGTSADKPVSNKSLIDSEVEKDFEVLKKIVTAIRAWRKDKQIEPNKMIKIKLAGQPDILKAEQLKIVNSLTKTEIELVKEIKGSDWESEGIKIKIK